MFQIPLIESLFWSKLEDTRWGQSERDFHLAGDEMDLKFQFLPCFLLSEKVNRFSLEGSITLDVRSVSIKLMKDVKVLEDRKWDESEMNYWLLDVSGGWSVDWCTGCCGRDRILGEIKWDIDAGKSSFSQSLDRCRVQMWSWLGRIKKFGGFLTLERERGILVGFFSNFAKPFQQFPVTPVNYQWHSIFLGFHQTNPILEK